MTRANRIKLGAGAAVITAVLAVAAALSVRRSAIAPAPPTLARASVANRPTEESSPAVSVRATGAATESAPATSAADAQAPVERSPSRLAAQVRSLMLHPAIRGNVVARAYLVRLSRSDEKARRELLARADYRSLPEQTRRAIEEALPRLRE
jgi:hypothetical protein